MWKPPASPAEARRELLELLRSKSVFRGDFVLASGARSNYYIDCRLTTLDAKGAWLVGMVVLEAIRKQEERIKHRVASIGGLTMGADPIALATSMVSAISGDRSPLRPFIVRKAAKGHGQTKLIEGDFRAGDQVVVIDDVITTGDSTIKAIEAVREARGEIDFIVALVNRQEGGVDRIEQLGYPVVPIFNRDELLQG
ncbi:MAG TPA: orotate phosphoribosyltransferase [Methylomirabilota bacterium]|nr:orotate phosphoribosyltransferase [Methylomirabilota bacterium]